MKYNNIEYDNIFNSSGFSFDAPLASVYNDVANTFDPMLELEQQKNKLLNTLEVDKDVFIGWLTTINIKHISTLKLDMLELLISCWLASKQHCKSTNVHKQELFKLNYKQV